MCFEESNLKIGCDSVEMTRYLWKVIRICAEGLLERSRRGVEDRTAVARDTRTKASRN